MPNSFWQFDIKPLEDFKLQGKFNIGGISVVAGVGIDPVGTGITSADDKVLRALRLAGNSTARNLAAGKRIGAGVFGAQIEFSVDDLGSAEFGVTLSQQKGGKFKPVPSLTIKGTDGRARFTTDLLELFYEVRQSVKEIAIANNNAEMAALSYLLC